MGENKIFLNFFHFYKFLSTGLYFYNFDSLNHSSMILFIYFINNFLNVISITTPNISKMILGGLKIPTQKSPYTEACVSCHFGIAREKAPQTS